MIRTLSVLLGVVLLFPLAALGDELTQIVQEDLQTLGYDPGSVDGESSVELAIAVSQFQAEHELEITGEVSPQLAGIIKSTISRTTTPLNSRTVEQGTALVAATAGQDNALAAQQACLQRRLAEAQESGQRRRGFSRFARAVSRTASRLGADGLSQRIDDLSSDVSEAGLTASEFRGAAEDLGLAGLRY